MTLDKYPKNKAEDNQVLPENPISNIVANKVGAYMQRVVLSLSLSATASSGCLLDAAPATHVNAPNYHQLSAQDLDRMLDDARYYYQVQPIAQHPNVRTEALAEMVETMYNPRMYINVVRNPNVTTAILARIVERTSNSDVLLAVAENSKTSPETLGAIIEVLYPGNGYHVGSLIVRTALGNPSMTRELADTLAYHTNVDVRLEVSAHPNTSPEALAELAGDRSVTIRRNVALHPNTNEETLTRLTSDSNEDVSRQARGALNIDRVTDKID